MLRQKTPCVQDFLELFSATPSPFLLPPIRAYADYAPAEADDGYAEDAPEDAPGIDYAD